jgi:uncharacterized protein involved in exopolysaccharide biosynthesis
MTPIFEVDQQDQFKSYSGKDIAALCFKHKALVLTVFLIITVSVNFMLFYIPSVYETNAKVLIHTERAVTSSFFAGVATVKETVTSDPVPRKIETEMQMIEGRVVAEEVVRDLDVKWDQVYHKPLVHLMEPVAFYIIDPIIRWLGYQPDPEKNGFNDTVEELVKSIKVAPVLSKSADTNSNIIFVSLKSPDPVVGRDILQKTLEYYRNYDIKMRKQEAALAYSIVNQKLEKTYADLTAAESALELFQSNKNNEKASTPNEPKLLTTPNDTSTIQLLKKQIIELEFEVSDLDNTFQPGDDKASRIKGSIKKLRERLQLELELYARNNAEQTMLERNLKRYELLYTQLKTRLSEIDLFIDMNEHNISAREILEPPLAPRESSFKKDVLLGVFGSIFGLMFGVVLAGIREFLDSSIRDDGDVSKHLGIEVIGKIPKEKPSTMEYFFKH